MSGYGVRIPKPDKDTCYYCSRPLDDYNRTKDHLIPKSKGGILSNNNKVWCCVECNRLKGDLTPEEFMVVLRSHINYMRRDMRAREGYYRKIILNVEKLIKSRRNK